MQPHKPLNWEHDTIGHAILRLIYKELSYDLFKNIKNGHVLLNASLILRHAWQENYKEFFKCPTTRAMLKATINAINTTHQNNTTGRAMIYLIQAIYVAYNPYKHNGDTYAKRKLTQAYQTLNIPVHNT